MTRTKRAPLIINRKKKNIKKTKKKFGSDIVCLIKF